MQSDKFQLSRDISVVEIEISKLGKPLKTYAGFFFIKTNSLFRL